MKPYGVRRSSATLIGMRQNQNGLDMCRMYRRINQGFLSLRREFTLHDLPGCNQERGIKVLCDCVNVRWIQNEICVCDRIIPNQIVQF